MSIAAEHRRYATVTSLIQGIKDPQETLRAVLEFDNLDMKKIIIRAWLNSTTNKLDAVKAICCVFASGPELWSRERFYKPDALSTYSSRDKSKSMAVQVCVSGGGLHGHS